MNTAPVQFPPHVHEVPDIQAAFTIARLRTRNNSLNRALWTATTMLVLALAAAAYCAVGWYDAAAAAPRTVPCSEIIHPIRQGTPTR